MPESLSATTALTSLPSGRLDEKLLNTVTPRSWRPARKGPKGWPTANWMSPLMSAGIAWAPPWAGTTSTSRPCFSKMPSSMPTCSAI